MSDGRVDQRVRLTKELLKDALVKRMRDQHISKISVRALCTEADLNRSTFYAHYSNPQDLLNSIESEVLDNLNQHLANQEFDFDNPISARVLTEILEYIGRNAELFRALLSENSDHAFQRDVVELAQVLSDQMGETLSVATRRRVETFCITGAIGLLQEWLREGMRVPAAEMAEFVVQLLYYGISGLAETTID